MSKENLIWDIEMALLDKQFKNGLSNYTQTNCQVTLTDNGYRIYRPANLTYDGSSATQTMWGGLRLKFIDKLTKGHTYVILFDMGGQSSNMATSLGFSNNMGWSGGGLMPAPSNVSTNNSFNSNFNGNFTHFYKFTINDDLYKVCTTAYGGFVKGQTYPSYSDFMFGFGYQNTGSMGTDIYLTNFRLYDITTEEDSGMFKNGNVNFLEFVEKMGGGAISPKLYRTNSMYIDDIWEI